MNKTPIRQIFWGTCPGDLSTGETSPVPRFRNSCVSSYLTAVRHPRHIPPQCAAPRRGPVADYGGRRGGTEGRAVSVLAGRSEGTFHFCLTDPVAGTAGPRQATDIPELWTNSWADYTGPGESIAPVTVTTAATTAPLPPPDRTDSTARALKPPC